MAPPSKNNQIVRRPDSAMPALFLTKELEQLLAVDVIEAEPLAMVPPTGGPSGTNPRSVDHVFGSTDPERGRLRTPSVSPSWDPRRVPSPRGERSGNLRQGPPRQSGLPQANWH